MTRFLRGLSRLDLLAHVLSWIGMGLIVCMVLVMFTELVARRALNAPTIWAADVTYMANGMLFLLGISLALRQNLHVRIDFIASRLPIRLQHAIHVLFYLGLFLPALLFIASISYQKAVRAYVTGELQAASAWSPLTWPFLAVISIALFGFLIQVMIETARHVVGLIDPKRVSGPSETPG
jgi:TRAP-type mannitol/chloroaromatic compound transport system permease small subunit